MTDQQGAFSLFHPTCELLLPQLQPPLFVPVPQGNLVLNIHHFFNAEHLASSSQRATSTKNCWNSQHNELGQEPEYLGMSRTQQLRGVCCAFVSLAQQFQSPHQHQTPKSEFVSLRPALFKHHPHNPALAGLQSCSHQQTIPWKLKG